MSDIPKQPPNDETASSDAQPDPIEQSQAQAPVEGEVLEPEQPNPEVDDLSMAELRIAELEQAVADAEQALHDQKEGALRALAEGENAKRRAQGEIDKARKFALEKFAGDLLPGLDNLEQAIKYADPNNEALKPVVDGLVLTQKTFQDTVEKHGLTVINPEGEPFNPELHQAMSMQENADVEPNTVIAVMQKGYSINGRLLRPAMVMVSKAQAPSIDVEA